jgi:hypothetical protein
MNKYQRALAYLSTYGSILGYLTKDTELTESVIALINELQELVDKATPKPLIEKWAWHCQTCGQGFVNHGGNKDNYCSNCGQRLTEEK